MLKKKDTKKSSLVEKVGSTESIVAPGTKFKGTIKGPAVYASLDISKGKLAVDEWSGLKKRGE